MIHSRRQNILSIFNGPEGLDKEKGRKIVSRAGARRLRQLPSPDAPSHVRHILTPIILTELRVKPHTKPSRRSLAEPNAGGSHLNGRPGNSHTAPENCCLCFPPILGYSVSCCPVDGRSCCLRQFCRNRRVVLPFHPIQYSFAANPISECQPSQFRSVVM